MSEATATEQKDPISIRISADEMQLLASGQVDPEEADKAVKELRGKLLVLGLNDIEAQDEAVERLATALETSAKLKDVVLLEGCPPVPPKDAAIQWTGDFFAKGFYIDPETGAADYRRLTAEVNVGEGDLLATISAPKEGKEGRDVFGHAVAARAPKDIQLRAGNNVRCDEATRTYYAATNGRIRHVGGTLSVDDVLNIKGSAGLETGHINHPGALVIGENVEPETDVVASGDIEIQGYVDSARIQCGGNLIVHGGITGGSAGRIEVKGNVFALFISNAELDAEGDVYIQREINQSKVRARGQVDVEKGRISGGDICALGGVYAERIGTQAGVPTYIHAGYDYKLHDKIEALLAELERLKADSKKIHEKVDPYRTRMEKLPMQAKEAISKLLLQLKEMAARQQEIQAEVESLHEDSESRCKREVYARREIRDDVSVTISQLTLLTKEVYEGPIKVAIMEGDIRLARTRLKH